jgi:hypothetical protein
MVKTKRGIEALVATVLLVLITIAAVGIIWGAVMPLIKSNIQSSQKCFDADIEVKQGGYTCYYVYDNTVKVQIARGEKATDLSDIQIQLSSGGTSKSIRVTNETVAPNDIPGANEEIAYTLGTLGLTDVNSVSISAIITVGKSTIMCPATQPVALDICG